MGRGVRLRKANSRHRAWTGEILKNRIFQLIVLLAVLAAIAAIDRPAGKFHSPAKPAPATLADLRCAPAQTHPQRPLDGFGQFIIARV
jgi:hypothetical protein